MNTEAPVTVPQLPHHRVKVKQPLQRVCNESNGSGKLCAGHLKRWYYEVDIKEQACGDVLRAFGRGAEIYRCEHCKTLYLPSPADRGGINVAGVGPISDFGLTLPPKDKDQQGKPAAGQNATTKG
jgi:hypothetical protein